ncbi:MAG: hypothetical protein ACI9SX_000915 [Pseudoalteromonas tetraodonis]|jgi:hypothetical protein
MLYSYAQETSDQGNDQFEVASEPSAKSPKNILVRVDDTGFTDIAPYGSEVHTPILSALAEQSCVLPITTPQLTAHHRVPCV